MKTTVIAFDIDGTLRCNCTETCRYTNNDIGVLASILKRMKNTTLIAWSGGGAEYAQSFIDGDDFLSMLFGRRCYSKVDYLQTHDAPDIAIDDMHDFALGKTNLIVREK